MSEEELKAIDYLQLCYDLSTIDNESLPKLATILNLIEKQYKKIEKAVDYIQQEIWLCEHDIEACCDDEQAIKQYYIDRKEIFEEIQEKLLEE
jgi:hypothetical protein